MSLADQANDAGVCWPSVASLVERTCLAVRTVQRALRTLEQQGLLACAVGAMKSNRYTLDVVRLKALSAAREAERAADRVRQRELIDAADSVTTPATVTPCHSDTPASVAPHPRQCGTQTVIEPNTNTPHTPQPSAGGAQAGELEQGEGQGQRETQQASRRRSPVSLKAWLAELAARDEDAISGADAVWSYAEAVQLPREMVALAWAEFKRRMTQRDKRQRDWRQTFRNYVEANYLGLWIMRPGEPAMLSSKGEQAQRWLQAQASAGEGGDAA